MNKYQDLTGQVFADLTAVRYIESDSQGSAVWEWLCVCGRTVGYSASAVKKSHTLSCGCRRKRSSRQFAAEHCWSPQKFSVCSKCDTNKSHTEFRKQYRGKSRIAFPRAWCKRCDNEARQQCTSKTPEARLAWALRTINLKAKMHGIPYAIVLQDFLPIPTICPALNTSMNYDNGRESQPTFDRRIPALGYVKGNVQLISHRANRIKNDATLGELKQIVAWLETQVVNLTTS